MRGLFLNHKLSLLNDLPLPQPAKDEALIRVRLAGICSTDLEMIRGYYPFEGILGHEFVGDVVQASDLTWLGARVVGEINLACHTCDACRTGQAMHCQQRRVLGIKGKDGVFAEYMTLPIVNLHRVPAEIPDRQAVFTEPLAAALEILKQVTVVAGMKVLLLGAGRLGLLAAQVLAQTGCELRVVAQRASTLELLQQLSIQTASLDTIPRGWADLGVDCTGNSSGFEQVRSRVRARGTIVLKSTFTDAASLNLSPLVVDEQTLIGSRCGPFEQALAWLAAGHITVEPLISARYPLRDGMAALAQAAQPGVLKVLLQPD